MTSVLSLHKVEFGYLGDLTLCRYSESRTMDTEWGDGTMEVKRSDSPWGKTAYVLKAAKVEAYQR